MKRFTLTAAVLFISILTFAAPVNTVVTNNGKWSQASTWSLGRLPIGGDTVVIPQGITLLLDNNLVLEPQSIHMSIYGTFNLRVGKLALGGGSTIQLFDGGRISNNNGNNSERITIGGIGRYFGGDGVINGPATATLTTPFFGLASGVAAGVLPVKFASFSVVARQQEVLVQWSTSEEINAQVFEVERSLDGINWTVAGTVAARGNSTSLTSYSYTDRLSSQAVHYYRVKEVSVQGKAMYTAIKSVKGEASEVRIASSNRSIVLQFPAEVKGGITVRLVAFSGQVAQTFQVASAYGQVILPTSQRGNFVVAVEGASVHAARQVQL